MKRDSLLFLRAVLLLAAALLVVVAASVAVDLAAVRTPMLRLAVMDYAEAHFLADATNRGLNQLLAVAFTVVAIAVPLTANQYSLKFLEFFITDPVNAGVLTLVVFSDLISFWLIFSLKQDFIPYFQLYLSFGLLMLCLAVLFPYLAYVFRFLHPSTLFAAAGGRDRRLRPRRHAPPGRGRRPAPGSLRGARAHRQHRRPVHRPHRPRHRHRKRAGA